MMGILGCINALHLWCLLVGIVCRASARRAAAAGTRWRRWARQTSGTTWWQCCRSAPTSRVRPAGLGWAGQGRTGRRCACACRPSRPQCAGAAGRCHSVGQAAPRARAVPRQRAGRPVGSQHGQRLTFPLCVSCLMFAAGKAQDQATLLQVKLDAKTRMDALLGGAAAGMNMFQVSGWVAALWLAHLVACVMWQRVPVLEAHRAPRMK